MPDSGTYFLEVCAQVSLKVATKGSFGGEKILKLSNFKVIFLKQKRRSVTKKWGVFVKFGIIIPYSSIYFLEVSADISFKVVTKFLLEVKKL